MQLRQNAREIVLIEVSGLGFILGEIRYNQQTETALFALEKAAFLDLYFPCTVVFDQVKGAVVRPHVLSVFTMSAVRIQRSHISCFIYGKDLNPGLAEQYRSLLAASIPHGGLASPPEGPPEDDNPTKPRPSGGKRVVSLSDHADKRT